MDPDHALNNATHAMKLAEDWLDVPMVRKRVGNDNHNHNHNHNVIIMILVIIE